MRTALSGAAVVLIFCGVVQLRLSWLETLRGPWLMLGGWLAIVAGFYLMAQAWGWEMGAACACPVLSMLALGIIGWGRERRAAPGRFAREATIEPEARATNWLRGTAKALLSIVLAGIASVGIGVALAVGLPLEPVDRIVLGGILVPVLWGGGMAWTLSDARLLRATVLLTGISVLAYAIAFLPKALG